ncbi:class I SAM-dependent methyltransferase [Nostocoides veronense]|uniref:class I SAM-dependent DNA methyltransferase n=1 Tax=Nostocoides veronense TaxID=330836 RepID=UPI0031E14FB8
MEPVTSSDLWDAEAAGRYDEELGEMASSKVIGETVGFLAGLAGAGPALEFAIGTGRVAVPLLRAGVPVTGIELSRPMIDQLRSKVSAEQLPVTIGDMATTQVRGDFSLVYLVFNTLGNLRTQAEQVACFRNAAGHLAPGGRFVIELWVPQLRRFPPGAGGAPFDVSERHTGIDTYDLSTQQGTSHHYTRERDGSIRYSCSNFRYAWAPECDLMAQLAGLEFEARYADWDRSPFTSDSPSHVSVWRKPL